jgi:ABC-type transport system involved in multi-copper enzyme maturation permease subunit
VSSIALTAAEQKRLHEARPSFIGLVGGELFKITRMKSTWVTFILMLCLVAAPNTLLLLIQAPFTESFKLGNDPRALNAFYNVLETDFLMLRVFIGFFLIILTANVIGREYQHGTIRILLARGVGRLQLLLAKVSAVVLTALLTLIIWLLAVTLLMFLTPLVKAGNLNTLQALNSDFWNNVWLYLLTILVSMGATILLTVALCAIGRSLAFGLTASALFFPIDNIGTVMMRVVFLITKNDFWKNVTAYFLGPNLNQMPSVLITTHHIQNVGASPLVDVDATHTLLVALVYSVIFIVVALVLTGRRDVKE